MMKYRQNHSTFIPRERPAQSADVPIEEDLGPSKEGLISQIEEYNNRIKEYDNKIRQLREQLEFKDAEIHSFSNIVFSLEEEINRLKNVQETINVSTDVIIDTAEIDRLNIELSNFIGENAELKNEIATQNEHIQLLYVLIILAII